MTPVEQSATIRGGDRLGRVRGAHSRKERGQMALDVAFADTETAGYLVCGFPIREQLER
jgi:hypothetical protein